MRKALLSLALAIWTLGVNAQMSDIPDVVEADVCSLPGKALTPTAELQEGRRYLMHVSDLLCSIKPNGDVTNVSGLELTNFNDRTDALNESYFWTVTHTADGKIQFQNVQSREYIASLEYGKPVVMTADVEKAAAFEPKETSISNLLQMDNEGGLGLTISYSLSDECLLSAGWDEYSSEPECAYIDFYDVDSNDIYRTETRRKVTLKFPQYNGEDVFVFKQFRDGYTVKLDDLPFMSLFIASGFAERSRKVDADHTSFTVNGEWHTPEINGHVAALSIAGLWMEVTETANVIPAYKSSETTIDRSRIWYFDNVRTEGGSMYVTIRNAALPENYGLAIGEPDKWSNRSPLTMSPTPSEFMLTVAEETHGSEKVPYWAITVAGEDSVIQGVRGGSHSAFVLDPAFASYNAYDEDSAFSLSIVEPADADFNTLVSFEYGAETIEISDEKREAARRSRLPDDFREMFVPSALVLAKVEYMRLKGYDLPYDSPFAKVDLPGGHPSNLPQMQALAEAIDSGNDAAASAAVEAAAGLNSPTADFTEGAVFRLHYVYPGSKTVVNIRQDVDPSGIYAELDNEYSTNIGLSIITVDGKNYLYHHSSWDDSYSRFYSAWTDKNDTDGYIRHNFSGRRSSCIFWGSNAVASPVEFAVWTPEAGAGQEEFSHTVNILAGEDADGNTGHVFWNVTLGYDDATQEVNQMSELSVMTWSGWVPGFYLTPVGQLTDDEIAGARRKIADINASIQSRFESAVAKAEAAAGAPASVNSYDLEELTEWSHEDLSPDELNYRLDHPSHFATGNVYALLCYPNNSSTANYNELIPDFNGASNLAFKVENGQCVLRKYVAGDSSFNWHLVPVADGDGSVTGHSFVHYMPSEEVARSGEQPTVSLTWPGESNIALSNVFSQYRNKANTVGSGYVDLVFKHADGSGFKYLPQVKAALISKNPEDAGLETTQIGGITVDDEESDAADYFDLSGRSVAHPSVGGIYIERRGSRVIKRIVR